MGRGCGKMGGGVGGWVLDRQNEEPLWHGGGGNVVPARGQHEGKGSVLPGRIPHL